MILGKWCAAGQSAESFGQQTPRTIFAVLAAHWKQQEWQSEQSITNAWLTARLFHSDPKKFPTLDKLTGKSRAPAKQSPEQLLSAVRGLKALLQGDNDDG